MGARSSRVPLQQWDMNELSRVTGLPPQQINTIYQEFMQAAGHDGQLDMKEFAVWYNRFPGAQQQDPRYMQNQIPRIFRTFDRDRSGALSFDEFLSAVIMMSRQVPRRDRIDFLIRQNNRHARQNGDDRIPAQYGQQVFRRLDDYYGVPPGREQQHWKQLDRDNRGYVTHQEMMDYISRQPAFNQRYQF